MMTAHQDEKTTMMTAHQDEKTIMMIVHRDEKTTMMTGHRDETPVTYLRPPSPLNLCLYIFRVNEPFTKDSSRTPFA